jgi:hypothetical protein
MAVALVSSDWSGSFAIVPTTCARGLNRERAEDTLMSSNSANDNALDAALHYASKNWRVFPLHSVEQGVCSCGNTECPASGKHPRIDRWQQQASTDPAVIRRWFEQQWPDANVGIVTGEALLVLDVDGYHSGDESIEVQFEKHGRPDTLQAISGSGQGTHYYFDCSGMNLRNRSNLWLGVDVRGNGGFVVACPSLHKSGGRYTWDGVAGCDAAIATVPEWLKTAIEAVGPSAGPAMSIVIDRQAEPPAEKFKVAMLSKNFSDTWLGERTDLADPSDSGHDLSIASMAALGGWTQQEITDLLIARRRNRNAKPKGLRYFERTVRKAMQAACLNVVNIDCDRPKHHSTNGEHGVINGAELLLKHFDPIRWYAQGIIHEGATLLSGDPKAGKSFFALQLACAIAAGDEFVFGNIPVGVHGRVLYLAKDDGSERRFKARLEALGCTAEAAKRLDIILPIAIPTVQDGLIDLLRTKLDRQEDPYVLVILDTFGAVNDPKLSGSVYRNEYSAMRPLQEVATEYRIGILVLHHTNKDKSNRGEAISSASGSHGVTGAVDSVLLLERDQTGAKLIGRSRDGGDAHLTLKRRETGGWECVDAPVPTMKCTKEQSEVTEVIRIRGAVTKEELASQLEISTETARRRLQRMVEYGMLVRLGDGRYGLPEEVRAA